VCSLPSAALGKGFAECNLAFAECFRHLAKNLNPAVRACYTHVGVELSLDFFKARDPACVHDLEAYIGLLKCPKIAKVKRDGEHLLSKAMKFVLLQSFDTWRWQMAAIQVGELVQAMGL